MSGGRSCFENLVDRMSKEKRKKILVVTHIRQLWSHNQSGSTYAINSLVDVLCEEYQVDVYCTKYVRHKPSGALNVFCGQSMVAYLFEIFHRVFYKKIFNINFSRSVLLNPDEALAEKEKKALYHFLDNKDYDLVIVEYLYNHHLLSVLRNLDVPVSLDAHDIMHLRSLAFKSIDLVEKHEMTKSVELECFSCYDTVFVIQEKENDYLKSLGLGNTLLVKRPAPQGKEVRGVDRMPGDKIKALFVGSSSAHNIDALRWFILDVWNNDLAESMELYVVGSVCSQIDFPLPDQVFPVGPLAHLEEIYLKADVALNPIRVGSGLKIKNVEALGYGLPVITSPLGADGMSDCIGSSVFVCEEGRDYIELFHFFFSNQGELVRASQAALEDSGRYFSKDSCFDLLKQAIAEILY